jgi:saccharopine dehydrogenase (NAD+, L-lysine-forming)
MNKIFIRNEISKDELRTPLIPYHVEMLIFKGFIVYIESSQHRIYDDKQYAEKGAIVTTKKWFDPEFKDFLIIGLKELSDLNKLDNHTHLYFSHSYKNQQGSSKILSTFYTSNSTLYDFEYFLINGKRFITFGIYAGIAGCIISLMQFKNKLQSLKPFHIQNTLLQLALYQWDLSVNIMGPYGNVGSGVTYVLDFLKIKYTVNKIDPDVDIFFNCIQLDTGYNETWFSSKTVFKKPIIICDISCDYTKPNNPIKLYNKCTTWENPVYTINNANIIAISNLPSLIPKDSSDFFSNKCCQLLLDQKHQIWKDNKKKFKLKYMVTPLDI